MHRSGFAIPSTISEIKRPEVSLARITSEGAIESISAKIFFFKFNFSLVDSIMKSLFWTTSSNSFPKDIKERISSFLLSGNKPTWMLSSKLFERSSIAFFVPSFDRLKTKTLYPNCAN